MIYLVIELNVLLYKCCELTQKKVGANIIKHADSLQSSPDMQPLVCPEEQMLRQLSSDAVKQSR